jgi:predicted small secreted protein
MVMDKMMRFQRTYVHMVRVGMPMLIVTCFLVTGCINTRDIIGAGEERVVRVIAAYIGAWIAISIGSKGKKPSVMLTLIGIVLFLYA